MGPQGTPKVTPGTPQSPPADPGGWGWGKLQYGYRGAPFTGNQATNPGVLFEHPSPRPPPPGPPLYLYYFTTTAQAIPARAPARPVDPHAAALVPRGRRIRKGCALCRRPRKKQNNFEFKFAFELESSFGLKAPKGTPRSPSTARRREIAIWLQRECGFLGTPPPGTLGNTL